MVDDVEAAAPTFRVAVLSVQAQDERHHVHDITGSRGCDTADLVPVGCDIRLAHVENRRRERLAGQLKRVESGCRSVGERPAAGERSDEWGELGERTAIQPVESAFGGVADVLSASSRAAERTAMVRSSRGS